MNMVWFLRMAKWLRHPPSWQRVVLVVGVIAACLLLVGFERLFGWPEALTLQNPAGIPKVRASGP